MARDTDPIDTPLPVPDVPGADLPSGAGGLPPYSALSRRQRMVVDASAFGDLALRTWVSSLLAATVPVVVATGRRRADLRSERANLDFYAELAAAARSGAFVSGADAVAPGHIAAGQPAGGVDRPRHRRQHRVSQQLHRGQPGTAQAMERLAVQQRGARPTLASRRRPAPHAVRHPRLHGFVVSGQRTVLFTALVLPVRLRRADVHVALSRQACRKVVAVQRFRLLRRRAERVRRGDGPSRARLSVHCRLFASHRGRPHRADRHIAGRLHVGAGGVGGRPARSRHPQLPRRHPRETVRRMVPGQPARPAGTAPVRYRPGRSWRPGWPTTAR